MTGRLSDEQRIAWLRLIRSEHIGPRTFYALLDRFGSASAALEAWPHLSRRAGRAATVMGHAEAERELLAAARLGIQFVARGEPDYPRALAAIESAPPLLAVRGNLEALRRPTVAIIGSRNASAAGLAFTERLARALGAAGFTVVSGLARGIDTRAHKGALVTGTAAVLAGGHARIYPAENEPLLERIVEEGGVAVSEMPLWWEPRSQDFPRRNRIVSGLSLGVVVVEAARKSGSLITARFALEQGREVFAVPGSPLDPRAEGTNDLIRQGATLCAAPEHVIEALTPLAASGRVPVPAAREPSSASYTEDWEPGEDWPVGEAADAPARDEERGILRLLGPAPVSLDELAREAGLPISAVQGILLELELAGRLIRHPNNAVSLPA